MKRQITITADNISNHFAGYAREHLATRIIYNLPDDCIDDGYTYKLALECADSNTYYALLDSTLTFDLPQSCMIAGQLQCQLSVINGDTLIHKTPVVTLTIAQSIEPTQEIDDKYVGLLDSALNDFNIAVANVPDVNVVATDSGADIITAKNGITETTSIHHGRDYVITQSDIDNIITQTLNIKDGDEVVY